MEKKKYRVLKIVAVICFVFSAIMIGLSIYIYVTPLSDDTIVELIGDIQEQVGDKDGETENNDNNLQLQDEYVIEGETVSKNEIVDVIKIIFAIIYFVQAIFYIIEGVLIYRAIKKGKTTLIIIFLLIGFIIPLSTLISAAINSSYDIISATNVISLIIKTVMLKQIFEIRRLSN